MSCRAARNGVRGHEAHVPGDGLDDDRRRLRRVRREPRFERGHVVVRKDGGEGGDRVRHAGRIAQPEGGDAAAGLHQQSVAVAVVAAVELHDDVAAGGGAREANGGHRRLGAGVHEADAFEPGRGDHAPAEFDFARGERAEGCALRRRALDGRDNGRGRVPEDERPEGGDVVDVAPPVGIEDVRAFAAHERHGRPADRAERADGAVHPAGKEFGGGRANGSVIHRPIVQRPGVRGDPRGQRQHK